MARRRKKEEVSVSFHYLFREMENRAGEVDQKGFSQSEFDNLVQNLLDFPQVDLSEEDVIDRLIFKRFVPIEKVTKINSRTAFGVFRSAYSGHAYDNSEKGKISADSVSLRPFHFLIYLSDTGRIYLAAQYLGGVDKLAHPQSD